MSDRRILVPLDASKLAERILPYAAELAQRADAQVTLYQVINPFRSPLPRWEVAAPQETADHLLVRAEAASNDYLRSVARPLQERGLRVTWVVECCKSPEVIATYAERGGFWLIMMSTHGWGGLTHWALGSVTERVLHTASVPLFVYRPKRMATSERPEGLLGTMVVPLDGSQVAEAILPWAIEMAQTIQCQVALITALPRRPFPGLGAVQHRPDVLAMEEKAWQYVRRVEAEFHKNGVQTTCTVPHGNPAERIATAALGYRNGFVVMAAHGWDPGRWLLGSTADKVVRASRVPVVVWRPSAPAQIAHDGERKAAGVPAGGTAAEKVREGAD